MGHYELTTGCEARFLICGKTQAMRQVPRFRLRQPWRLVGDDQQVLGELKEVRRHCYQLVGGRAGGKSPPAHHVKLPNLSGLPAVLILILIKEF